MAATPGFPEMSKDEIEDHQIKTNNLLKHLL